MQEKARGVSPADPRALDALVAEAAKERQSADQIGATAFKAMEGRFLMALPALMEASLIRGELFEELAEEGTIPALPRCPCDLGESRNHPLARQSESA